MLAESLSSHQKNFFSECFNVSLRFNPNGGLEGKLYPFRNLDAISVDLTGLHLEINSNTVLSFMGHFTDPNLTAKTFLCFSGEIIKYEKQRECLILRWATEQESAGFGFVDRDVEILFDSCDEDLKAAIVKVREHLGKHSLQLIN